MYKTIALTISGITLIGIAYTIALTPNFLDFGYHADKTLHLLTFFTPMLIITLVNSGKKKIMITSAIILFAIGLSIEIAQLFSASRSTQWEDITANTIGIFLGYISGYLMRTGYHAK